MRGDGGTRGRTEAGDFRSGSRIYVTDTLMVRWEVEKAEEWALTPATDYFEPDASRARECCEKAANGLLREAVLLPPSSPPFRAVSSAGFAGGCWHLVSRILS